MTKKIMLVGFVAVSAMMLALPAIASAQIPLHLNSQPVGAKQIHGIGAAIASRPEETTITCSGFSGSMTFTSTTGGTMELTFGPHCTESLFGTTCTSHNPVAPAGSITTTELRFDLVTLAGKDPGIRVTPNTNGAIDHYTCAGGLINGTTEAHAQSLPRDAEESPTKSQLASRKGPYTGNRSTGC